ncbi:MAG TPA: molybdenum cofactor biosynthesis protein MoaE [Chthoniobacterales bacterium]|nr:molybdenum cofactor biosynthesis protein MoaE [Chthoniobacterales bacterium]
MANSVCEVLVTESALQTPEHDNAAEAGAVVDFFGVVRKMEGNREIEGIQYEAHFKMAEHQLRLIGEAAAEKFQLKQVVLHHRTGLVGAGEASLFLRVTAPHRGAAFDASKWIVDELKKKVPIWKKPAFSPSRTGTTVMAASPGAVSEIAK